MKRQILPQNQLRRCDYFAHSFQIHSQSTPPISHYSISYLLKNPAYIKYLLSFIDKS